MSSEIFLKFFKGFWICFKLARIVAVFSLVHSLDVGEHVIELDIKAFASKEGSNLSINLLMCAQVFGTAVFKKFLFQIIIWMIFYLETSKISTKLRRFTCEGVLLVPVASIFHKAPSLLFIRIPIRSFHVKNKLIISFVYIMIKTFLEQNWTEWVTKWLLFRRSN